MTTKVLVVDDDPLTCELIHEVLSSAEIEACGVTDSRKAAALLQQEKFDAAFLDARMPAPDGIELTRQIRASALNKKTLVVMITGDETADWPLVSNANAVRTCVPTDALVQVRK